MSRGMNNEEARAALDRTREVALYGHLPDGPVMEGASSPAAGDDDLFNPDDLSLPTYRAERYRMPGGKGHVWVHPISVEEAVWVNSQAQKEVERLQGLTPYEANLQRIFRAQVYQVILACRKGPEPTATRIFHPDHAEKLRKNPGWIEAIQQIAALSDQIAGGETEAARLREALTDFFDRAGSWLGTCALRLTGASETLQSASLAALAAFATSVSSMRQPEKLTDLDLLTLTFPALPEEDSDGSA